MFLYNRGRGAKRRVMHLAMFDKHGNIAGSWCGRRDFNTSINVPLGLRVCKFCKKAQGHDGHGAAIATTEQADED